MKKLAVLIGVLVLLAVPAYLLAGQCGGFETTVTHTAPGEATFTVVGENDYGTVDVNGTFVTTQDKVTGAWTCEVTFGENSTVVASDGTVTTLDGTTLTLSGDSRGQKQIVYSIVQYIKSILEG